MPAHVPDIESLIADLASPTPEVKYGASKSLRLMSEKSPEALYPHFDFFVGQLDHESSFIRWDATTILANLARVDRAGKIEAVLDKLLAPVRGPQLIGAAKAMMAASDIARAKPQLAKAMAGAILRVRKARYQTEECRRIGAGHAITALDRMMPLVEDRRAALNFVRSQRDCSRAATRKKAEKFLRKWDAKVK